jgi:hypothetical protein
VSGELPSDPYCARKLAEDNTTKKRYAHACPDWDFMQINEDSAELVGCSCFSDPEFLAIRECHSKELDRVNSSDLIGRLRRLAETHAAGGLYTKAEWIEWEAAEEIDSLGAAIREIANGFAPDGTYTGRPIYEIAPQCFTDSGDEKHG